MLEFLALVLQDSTPVAYAALAAVLAQRSGIFNLGLEGLMIVGSFCGVIVTAQTGSLMAGVGTAIAACVLMSALLWWVVQKLGADPVIAGLGVSGLGLGGTHFALQAIYGSDGTVQAPAKIPSLSFLPGPLGNLSVLVGLLPVVMVGVWIYMYRTRRGLQLTACGEHPFAARAVGVSPARRRLEVLCLGGVLCALAGLELAMGNLQSFGVGMTSGRGYLALAVAIFGLGHPIGAVVASSFFGILDYLDIKAQIGLGNAIPPQLIQALPYIATVAGTWLTAVLRPQVNRYDELRD